MPGLLAEPESCERRGRGCGDDERARFMWTVCGHDDENSGADVISTLSGGHAICRLLGG